MEDFLWWRDGVIYQIYPRSFKDTNGDGIGDLKGIIKHLPYLSDLGIDAIWLSPIYPSPDVDFGYDVSDYLNIDPKYGTLHEFDKLVVEAHKKEIRIIMDMVLNHTSIKHPWFIESRSSRDNPKHDWYIWRDSLPGKIIPNNWQASFGGNAWEYDPLRKQYYLHSFTRDQPDVNWRNPDVRKAQLSAFKFWLDRGVDGFRLDVFNAYYKHPDLPDNPPRIGFRKFDRQYHLYDMDQPELITLLKELRQLLDSYPEKYLVGETYFATLEKTVTYSGSDRLHAAFSFDFTNLYLAYPWYPAYIRRKITAREKFFNPKSVWPTNVLSNHDLPRAASRYAGGENDDRVKIVMGLLLTLRGTPFIYYGEEIGMRDIHLPHSKIMDPAGKMFWPIYKGRDGSRSPMQWNADIFAGFSTSKPWLPVNPDYFKRNVASQQENPKSLLNFTKTLLALRKKLPALYKGDYVPIKTGMGVFGFIRKLGDQEVIVLANFSRLKNIPKLPFGKWNAIFTSSGNYRNNLGSLEFKILIKD